MPNTEDHNQKPMVSTEEQKALDEILEATRKMQEDHCYFVRHALRMTTEDLRHSGYKTQDAAIVYSARSMVEKIEKLHKAHIRKFPD